MSLEERKVINYFEKNEASSVSWIDTISGEFITSSNKVGALKLWSASQQSHKEMIKVAPQAIVSMTLLTREHKDAGIFLL